MGDLTMQCYLIRTWMYETISWKQVGGHMCLYHFLVYNAILPYYSFIPPFPTLNKSNQKIFSLLLIPSAELHILPHLTSSKLFVILILNVSRKFSMCIIFSIGYIKIYNINSSNEYFIQQHAFVQSTMQYNSSKT